MLALEVSPMPNGFMMKYSISERSDSVKAFGKVLSDSDGAGHIGDNRLQQPWPEDFFVSNVEKTCPKAEGQLRDYPSRVERLSVFGKGAFCFFDFIDFLRVQYSGQVEPCICFEMHCGGIVNTVSEAYFQALKR